MIQFHLDTMPCHLNYAMYDWWFNFTWTLCRAIWPMPFMIDGSISFGHYAVPFDPYLFMIDDSTSFNTMPCHLNYAIYDSFFDLWPVLLMTPPPPFHLDTMLCHLNYAWWSNFIWTLCRAIWSRPSYDWWLNFIWTLCRAIWSMLFMFDDLISFGHYAVPFDLCLMIEDSISSGHHAVPFMIQFLFGHYAVPFGLCHLCFNFIWTLCRAIWPMPPFD